MCGCAMAVRDDGQMAVLGDEDLAGLPSSGGPWQDLPLACFPMGTEKQLALAAKRLVGMARAPVGTEAKFLFWPCASIAPSLRPRLGRGYEKSTIENDQKRNRVTELAEITNDGRN